VDMFEEKDDLNEVQDVFSKKMSSLKSANSKILRSFLVLVGILFVTDVLLYFLYIQQVIPDTSYGWINFAMVVTCFCLCAWYTIRSRRLVKQAEQIVVDHRQESMNILIAEAEKVKKLAEDL